MSLDLLIKGIQCADSEVQRGYTLAGNYLPKMILYPATTVLWTLGSRLGYLWRGYFGIHDSPVAALLDVGVNFPDMSLNIAGLLNSAFPETQGDAIAVNKVNLLFHPEVLNFYKDYNRAVRLPVFALGAGLIGQGLYEAAHHFLYGAPLSEWTYLHLKAGSGFLALASSMYLKDQDPKLLQKRPSIWQRIDAWVTKQLTRPEPAPVYIPVRHDDYCILPKTFRKSPILKPSL